MAHKVDMSVNTNSRIQNPYSYCHLEPHKCVFCAQKLLSSKQFASKRQYENGQPLASTSSINRLITDV